MNIGSVVQFNKRHKWCGCLGIIEEIKDYAEEPEMIRYLVGVPVPKQGTAYIFVYNYENTIEYIGESIIPIKKGDEDERNSIKDI